MGESVIRFRVLGSLEVLHNNTVCTPTAPKPLQVLAVLLLRANQIIPTEALVHELWSEDPPVTAVTTAQTYIYQLRKTLHRLAGGDGEGAELLTRPPGYLLRIRQEQLDLDSFSRFAEQGRALLETGHPEAGAQRLRHALALWQGPTLANVAHGPLLEAHVADLDEQRMNVLFLRIQADLALGRHRDLVGELRALVAQHPLNEWLHGSLIVALSGAGRRGEALQAYHHVRKILREELGVDPSAELQRIRHEVLTADVFRPGASGVPVVAAAS